MHIPPKFLITDEIIAYITDIKAHLLFFESLDISVPLQTKINRVSVLKSSLFSARIEGNPLTTETLEHSEEEHSKTEIFNILDAQEYIQTTITHSTSITTDLICTLHNITMKNLRSDAGKLRTDHNAIFDKHGNAVYVPPAPSQVPSLLENLCSYIHSAASFPLITALVAHLIFEKIHPFIDGNGRVGRLLIPSILRAKGYSMPFVVPFEEYLDTYKSQYYYVLDIGLKDTNEYLTFMLKAFLEQLKSMRIFIETEMKKKVPVLLSLRQEEIYLLTQEQGIVSLDMLQRRFANIPERTLRYDLQKLQEKQLIEKKGATKGTYYQLKK